MEDETLPIDLTQEKAASLFLILEQAIDTILRKKELLASFKLLPKDKLPEELQQEGKIDEVMALQDSLVKDALAFREEVINIIHELDKNPNSPIIIPKPKF